MERRRADAGTARGRDEWVLWLVLVALAVALTLGAWAWRLDRVVYDFGLGLWKRPVPPDIVIVAIDDASIEAIGRWPWARSVHATLLEQLARARPRAIALDLVLSEPDPDPRQDALLAAALGKAGLVCMPVMGSASRARPLAVLEPVPVLKAQACVGASEPAVDGDGVLRHAFLGAGPAGQTVPHLALQLLRAAGEKPAAGLPVETDAEAVGDADLWRREGRFLVRFAGPPGHLRRVSYVDVLRGAVPASELSGRYLFVGMTAQGLGDTLATPVNGPHHAMPGVEVLAHTLYTLRSGDHLQAVATGPGMAVAAALLGLLIGLLRRVPPRTALAIALLSVPTAVIVSIVLLNLGLWWSPWAYALPALAAYPLWSWRRLERAAAALDREIAAMRAEPGLLAVVDAHVTRPDAAPDDGLSRRLQALHHAADTLRAARSFLSQAVQSLPSAVLVDDGMGRVMLANPPAARIFEVESEQELRGLDLARLLSEFHTEPAVDWADELQRLRRAHLQRSTEASLPGQGDYVLHLAGIRLEGLSRIIVSLSDVAPLKQAERDREQTLAFITHDLRSPLASILLLADTSPHGDGPVRSVLDQMSQLARRAQRMSEDFVRTVQAARQPLVRAPASLQLLLQDMCSVVQPQAQAAGVTLQRSVEPADLAWSLDAGLVGRAVGNLLTNALRASPHGGTVRVEARVADGHLVVQVSDQGPGLDAHQRDQLRRGDAGLRSADARGLGLGLLFVQRVAARHGGSLRQLAEPGSGAVFELRIGPAPDGSSGR